MKFIVSTVTVLTLSACAHEQECPSGYARDRDVCVPSDGSGGAGGEAGGGAGTSSSGTGGSGGGMQTTAGDAGAAGEDAGGTGGEGSVGDGSGGSGDACSVPQEDVLGSTCASDDDCACSAPLCAKSPFDDYGFCTEGDCDPADDQCPDGYHCVEIAIANVTYCTPDE